MKNITPGHWVFAAIFAVAFIGALIWAYGKDRPVIQKYYKRNIIFILGIILALFLLFIFKNKLR